MRRIPFLLICCVIIAQPVRAGEAQRYVSVGLDGGFAWALGDGSDLWESGASAGINFFYPITPNLLIGGRAALDRWRLNDERAATAIIPPGASVMSLESDGEFRIAEITPLLRLHKNEFIWQRMGGFVQIGGGLYRVSFDAETVVQYTTGGPSEVVIASADGADVYGGLTAGAGLSFTISADSRLDVYPAYAAIFENGDTTEFVTLLVAFRVEFSPWEKE